jgi:hypothetical protein
MPNYVLSQIPTVLSQSKSKQPRNTYQIFGLYLCVFEISLQCGIIQGTFVSHVSGMSISLAFPTSCVAVSDIQPKRTVLFEDTPHFPKNINKL